MRTRLSPIATCSAVRVSTGSASPWRKQAAIAIGLLSAAAGTSAAGLASPVATLAAGTSTAGTAATMVESLTLHVGQAHVLNVPAVRRIAVGNGKVVQATAFDGSQVLLIPEAPGHSTIHLWGKAALPRAIDVQVLPAELGRALAEVRALVGTATNVKVRPVGDKIILEGDRLSDEQALRLAEIGKRIPQVVNLASKVAYDRMIGMDVRMIEIRRDVLQRIGVRWATTAQGPSFGIVGDLRRTPALTPGGFAADGATAGGPGAGGIPIRPRIEPFATAVSLATALTSSIDLLVQNGDAVVLAEPRLSCRSGGSARFVAGGELPVPFSGGLGATGVTFREYGVKFDVSPVASESGTISARIATEISSVNFDVAVREVPGLSKRRAETEVNLREHETIVIAGLLSEDVTHQVDRVPAIGDVPLLGPLFRSRLFRERKTELVVLITPYFLDGAPPGVDPAASASPPVPSFPPAPSSAPAPRQLPLPMLD